MLSAASSRTGIGSPTRPRAAWIEPAVTGAMRKARANDLEVLDEPVGVGDRVLRGDRPLLALAPRREVHAAVVLEQPVGVAPTGVVREEVAVVVQRCVAEDDAPLAPYALDVTGEAVAPQDVERAVDHHRRATRRSAAYASGVRTSSSVARAAAIVSGLPLNVPTWS